MTPKISVIVPVYNVEKYLPRCIDSILSQTFKDFELLLIDDGSPDNSGKICDDYKRKDVRVRVFHKENGGVSSARNLGLDNAKGEWITFSDSDDSLEPNAFARYIEAAEYSRSQIIRAGYRTIYANGEIRECRIKVPNLLSSKDDILQFMESSRYFGFLWNSFYHNTIIKKVRFETHISWCEDHLFSLIAYSKSNSIYFIPDIVYNYVKQESDSLSYPKDPYMIIDIANLEYDAKKKLTDSKKISEDTISLYKNKIGIAITVALQELSKDELLKFLNETRGKIKFL